MLCHTKLSKQPCHFKNFTGLSVSEFSELACLVREDWQVKRSLKHKPTEERKRKIGGGRKLALPSFEDRLLVYLVYAKLYMSYWVLEYLFGADESSICRIVQEIAPLLSIHIPIDKSRKKITTLEELYKAIPDLDEVLIDATEQKVQRPKKKSTRKKHHSGKKKAHTMKTQIMTDSNGLILRVSKSIPGRKHDYKYFKEDTKLLKWLKKHADITAYGDSGYQGVGKDYPDISMKIPIKRTRAKKELTRSEKIRNTRQSKKRIVIEHTFSKIKKYRILGETYRNSKEQYSNIFKSIAFLTNLKMLARAG